MAPSAPLPESLRFGRFELRPAEHRLLADGQPVALGGRAFDLLIALAQRRGELVTRNELIERVWPGRVVEENNLSVQVNALRKVLGNEWLSTVPGRGYRFVVPMAPPPAAEAAAPVAAAGAEASARSAGPSDLPAVPGAAILPAALMAPPADAGFAADALPGPRTHLPALQPLLLGRSDDLAALGTLIEQHRLVTVVGAGGMGKTRLAQALLHLRAGSQAHGVCWVELGPVTTADALPAAVAAALGVQLPPGDALARLARAVSGLQLLLALDNAEHLLDGVATLAQALLDAAPGVGLLVTSQAPLRLAAERVLRLGPLAVPQGALPAHQAQAFGAVALFCERAAAADHRFALRDAEVPAVIELCRRLDGVALAIELAAARAPALGIERLLASLGERLHVLSRNRDRHAPARQQSLRAAVAWSVGLLAPREQQLFQRLAVLAGSASMDLVQQVGHAQPDDPSADPWEVVDALDTLIQRSLVEVVTPEDEGLPRYRLLESPRALALELLAASGEEAAVRLRHAHGVRRSYEALRRALHAGELGVRDWRRGIEAELANAREALAYLDRDDAAPPAGRPDLQLALASAMLQAAQGDERLALADRCERALQAGRGGPPGAGADADADANANANANADAGADAEADGGPDAQRSRSALACRAWREISIALANLRPDRSLAAGRRALALARQRAPLAADRYELYDALCGVAHMVVDDDIEEAMRLVDEARGLEDPSWSAYRRRPALRVQASIATARGDADAARHLYRRLLDADRGAGEANQVTLLNMANAELAAGDAAAAVASGERLVAMLRDRRDENFVLFARVNLAAAHLALDQVEAARGVLLDLWAAPGPTGSSATAGRPGLPRSSQRPRARVHAWCVDVLALLAALQGRPAHAAQLVGAADTRYAATASVRQVNEQRAHERTLALIRADCPEDLSTTWQVQGRGLSDDEVTRLALSPG